MALVVAPEERTNPLPIGRYFVTIESDHVRDFDVWLSFAGPRVSVQARAPKPSAFGGSDELVTFLVRQPVHWPDEVFGFPNRDQGRVPEPVSDAVNKAAEGAKQAVEHAAEAAAGIIPLLLIGGVLYWLFTNTKGRRHAV